jgi:hypothetical protein
VLALDPAGRAVCQVRACLLVGGVVTLLFGAFAAASNGEDIQMSSHHVAAPPVAYTHAFRVGLTFEDGKVTISSVQRVAMRAPASAEGLPADGQSGVWVALKAEDGKVLYHRALRTPQLDSVEVFDDEKTGAIRRVPTTRRAAKMDVILPDLPDAAEFELYGPANMRDAKSPSVRLLGEKMQGLRR